MVIHIFTLTKNKSDNITKHKLQYIITTYSFILLYYNLDSLILLLFIYFQFDNTKGIIYKFLMEIFRKYKTLYIA